MSWGSPFELYILQKKSENVASGNVLAYLNVPGELWTREELVKFADDLDEFNKKVQKAVNVVVDSAAEDLEGSSICIRTNR